MRNELKRADPCGIGLYSDLHRQHPAYVGESGSHQDLASYSLGNIVLANIGNLTYAVYVLSLPIGPVWALHGFHLCATALMLFWYVRHAGLPHSPPNGPRTRHGSDETIRRSG